MTEQGNSAGARLNALLALAGQPELNAELAQQFASYLELLLRWNQRLNLTGIREQEEILARHFVESIVCARALPAGIATLLDFGSGAGLPGIPIALCRPEIAVTLAESQGKKAAFLNEVLRSLKIVAKVHAGRAETLTENFDCVTLRAVDRMEQAVETAVHLLRCDGAWIALMTTDADLPRLRAVVDRGWLSSAWGRAIRLPGSEGRLVALAHLAERRDQPGS